MDEEFNDEIQAINSIYGKSTIRRVLESTAPTDFLLTIPQHDMVLRLSIPSEYPGIGLEIVAIESVGSNSQKGDGNRVLFVARGLVEKIFTPGQVCLFDLLQELEQTLNPQSTANGETYAGDNRRGKHDDVPWTKQSTTTDSANTAMVPPQWALSTTVTEKKSVFLARACAVNSTLDVQSTITHLLSTDKRAGKATHNVNAYRIRTIAGGNEIVYQDCDDDGEAAAGGRLLKLLQLIDAWNVLVVVSRWYGGVKLGPGRFGIINAVAREAVIAGGFARD
ncbi:MAG: hypothetical protein Q9170_000573 [Blastenia crenularia]